MELAKILLHLSDVYALPGFTNTRHSSLVALAVTRPRLVAPYLTREFYAPNYNLRQRMDILEVSCELCLKFTPLCILWLDIATECCHQAGKILQVCLYN